MAKDNKGNDVSNPFVKAVDKAMEEAGVPIGAPAPSDPPPLSAADLERMINERVNARVDEAVEQKLADLDAGLDKDTVTQEDSQFSNFEQKLVVFGAEDRLNPIPGWHVRWFNDEGDRINRMRAIGYIFVTKDEVALNYPKMPDDQLNKDLGEYIAVYVGTKSDNTPMRAFLMKIPQEAYDKRYEREQRINDDIEDAIQRGHIGNALSNRGYAGTDQGVVKIGYNPRTGMQRMLRPKP